MLEPINGSLNVHIGEQHLRDINQSLCELIGIDVHIRIHDNDIGSADTKSSDHRSVDSGDVDSPRKPVLTIQDLDQQEVNHRTGFCDLWLMLSFVLVVWGADLTIMTHSSSLCTWLEEWILCFESVWGRTLLRYKD